MPIYAEGTKVSESKSKVELDEILRKWKASNVAVGGSEDEAIVYFAVNGWAVKFKMRLPDEADAVKHTPRGRGYYTTQNQRDAWREQERRRRWRALVLTIKAKLVSVENAVESFEDAFLAHLCLEGGVTVADAITPQLREAKKLGQSVSPMRFSLLLGSGA